MPWRGPNLAVVFKLDPGDVAKDTAQEWGRRAAHEVRERTPVSRPDPFDDDHEPGNLRDSWRVTTRKTLRGYRATVYSNVSYAVFVEEGTHPHVIRARNAQSLRFMAGGGVVFARQVNHPGTTGHHMLKRGIAAAGAHLEEAGRVPLRNMMRRWRAHIVITGRIKR